MQMYTIGCDVEIFAKDKHKFRSLIGKIGGTKENPKQLEDMTPGFCVQEDNVSLEFNIPPANTQSRWLQYINAINKEVSIILAKQSLIISTDAAAVFPEEELQHPMAKVFGCEPDYNAWTKMENPKPQCDDPLLRTAGGHIHVGTKKNMLEAVKCMDMYLGVPSVIIDSHPTSILRRKLYGKAGAMRPKPYGFEYRVLSNFWIFSEELAQWVYQQTRAAIETNKIISIRTGNEIQRIINEGDTNAAASFVKDHGIALPVGFK